jgi:hypothetical protein
VCCIDEYGKHSAQGPKTARTMRRQRKVTNGGAVPIVDRNPLPLQCDYAATGTPCKAVLPQCNAHLFYGYNAFLKQRRKPTRRSRQWLPAALQRIGTKSLRPYEVSKIAFLSFSCLLSCWISQRTLQHLFTEEPTSSTSRTTLSFYNKILRRPKHTIEQAMQNYSVVFPMMMFNEVSRGFARPTTHLAVTQDHDFGGLHLRIAEEKQSRLQARTVYHDYHSDIGYLKIIEESVQDDDVESYYAFDDDIQRNTYEYYDDPDIHLRKQCRRTNWHRGIPTMCNSLHELDFQTSIANGNSKFVG